MSIDFGQSSGINFSLSDDQKKVQLATSLRTFSRRWSGTRTGNRTR
jgi:hypothetical protein